MTTVVTGAGLIGTAFAALARGRGEHVVFVDPEPRADFVAMKLGGVEGYTIVRRDVRDLPGLIDVMQRHKAHTVVHTAGLIGSRVQASLGLAFDINLGGTRNVAEAVRLTGVKRLVHISTFGVYDSRRVPAGPVTEDYPKGATRGYGNYKVAKELILEAYAAEYKFELAMLRPANVFGLGHFWAGSSGGAKMQALLEAGLDGRPAIIPANETMANEYVYAKDVGRAVDLAATRPLAGTGIYNVGNGEVTPFDALVGTVRSILPGLTVHVGEGAPPKSKSQPLDISAAKRDLGWAPTYSLKAAFEDYLADLMAARASRG